MKISWPNVIENSIYIILIGVLVIISNQVTIANFEGMVQASIAKETTKIENTFETEIKKLKAKHGGTVDVHVKPAIDNKAQTVVQKDSVPHKRTFWQKIWGKNKAKN